MASSLALLAVGCHRHPVSAPVLVDGGASSAPVVQAPDVGGATAPPERKVTRLPPIGRQVALLQIVVSHKDVHIPWVPTRAKSRTPAEAEKIAHRLAQDARHGADFVKLAKEWSDWPLAARNGGQLGILVDAPGNVPEVTAQGFKLEVGGVSDAFPTQFGYVVLKRLPLVRISHVVIGYAGLPGGHQTRSREEAERLAARVREEITSGKVSFADAAFEHSDELVSAGRGGDIGSFEEKSGVLPQFQKVALALKKGEVSAPFDSPLGIEVLQRTE